jgi:phospholipid/cholesterol/gamma-HCH transport system substrate-binding protein
MRTLRRVAAGTALVVALAVIAFVLLGGGPGYQVQLRMQNASQLVKGNLVQVAGTKVGKVTKIGLTPDGQAQVTVTIDGDYAPLHEGTQAVVRQASLSGVANRYIDLQQGPMTAPRIPSGGVLPATNVESAVDLDQLFNAFDPKTRAAGRQVIQGFADMAQGHTREANMAIQYLNPVLSASQRFFGELDRNDALLERFVVRSAQLVTDVAAKRDRLAGIVNHFGTVSTALAAEQAPLRDAIAQLPEFLRKSNSTFVNLRATLNDLDPLVNASKPVVRQLRPLLTDLRAFAHDSPPTFRDLATAIRKPGPGNDLVELLRAQPALSRAANDPVQANGAQRGAAFPEIAKALNASTPEMAFFRPYAPDLTGWFDDFSSSGVYDALGSFSRAGLAVSSFTFTPLTGAIVPVPPELRDQVLAANSKVGRNDRCPGSDERDPGDHSTTWRPTPDFNCDPTIQPIGP